MKIIILTLMATLLLAGCGQGGGSKADAHAFDSAPSPIKDMWADAAAAAKTNDYVAAQHKLYALARHDLTEQQRKLIENTIYDVSERLTAALKKGDPAAIKVLEELRRNPPNRPSAK